MWGGGEVRRVIFPSRGKTKRDFRTDGEFSGHFLQTENENIFRPTNRTFVFTKKHFFTKIWEHFFKFPKIFFFRISEKKIVFFQNSSFFVKIKKKKFFFRKFGKKIFLEI